MRIITGRGGSGKTTMLLQEIAQAAERGAGKQMLLVPELFSHAYERRVAAHTGGKGARTAEVLTFSRLTGRIFAEVGGLADTVLSPAGRLLTMQQAVLQAAANLQVYASAAERPEMVRELLQIIDEMKNCTILPEQLFEAMGQMHRDETELRAKLSDLAQIYTIYDRLCDESLPDPRDALTLLAERLPDSHALDGVTVYLDGFFGFTAQERAVLEVMLQQKVQITACITCDETQPEIFATGCKTLKMLRRIARKYSIAVEHVALGQSRMQRPQDLAALEAEGLLPASKPRLSDQKSLQIYAASSPYEECEYAAAYIRQVVRETGARYHEFVIAAREIAPYTAVLQMVMERYEIPVFISEKEDLLQKPPLALLTTALAAVTNGYRYEDLFACLRTGLCALELDAIDRLENYALTWRIQGKAWQRPFAEHPDGYGLELDADASEALAQLNALREQMIAPFVQLEAALRTGQTAQAFAQALYDFLEAVEAPMQIQLRAQAHETAGRLQMAEEYRQLWEILVSALEQFAWVCGEAEMDAERFARLFTLVLSEYDVATIPVSLDRVACGDMERITSENMPYVILLGMNDGVLPKPPTPSGVLTETERVVLDGMGVELSAFGAERMMMEMELLYRAFACPRERMLLCWHTTDMAGTDARPSYLIGSITKMMEGVPTDSSALQQQRFRLAAKRPGVDLACSYLSGNEEPAAVAAYQHYAQEAQVRRAQQQELTRGPLQAKHTAQKLYGQTLRLTASRLDKFYSCRFAFFLQYGLKAKPRKVASFAAPEMGTFLHFVLENTLAILDTQQGGAAAATKDAAFAVMKQVVQQYVEQQLGGLQNKTARFRYLFRRLVKSMEAILEDVLEELKESAFRPIDFELDFSERGDLQPVTCQDEAVTAQLIGKVDRVDGYIRNGKLYIRVMDYKSGKKAFSLSDIWHGLNMQMILYLYALQEHGVERYQERLLEEINSIEPAGVLYIPAREELVDADRDITEESLRLLRQKELRRSGIVTDDMDILEAMEQGLSGEARFIPVKLKAAGKDGETTFAAVSSIANLEKFGKLARYTKKKLMEMAHAVTQGDVQANPYRSGQQEYCAWCEFRAACQFDERAGDGARVLRSIGTEEFWESLEENTHGNQVDG